MRIEIAPPAPEVRLLRQIEVQRRATRNPALRRLLDDMLLVVKQVKINDQFTGWPR